MNVLSTLNAIDRSVNVVGVGPFVVFETNTGERRFFHSGQIGGDDVEQNREGIEQRRERQTLVFRNVRCVRQARARAERSEGRGRGADYHSTCHRPRSFKDLGTLAYGRMPLDQRFTT